MGYIYKITNLITHKSYVGQTTSSIERRWAEHKSKAKSGSIDYLLYKAIRKYGINNFVVEMLEECPNNQIDEREIYWIKQLNTFLDGYNMTLGGDTNRNSSPTQEEVEEWWKRFINGESVSHISATTRFGRTTIQSYLCQRDGYKKIAKKNIAHRRKKRIVLPKHNLPKSEIIIKDKEQFMKQIDKCSPDYLLFLLFFKLNIHEKYILPLKAINCCTRKQIVRIKKMKKPSGREYQIQPVDIYVSKKINNLILLYKNNRGLKGRDRLFQITYKQFANKVQKYVSKFEQEK